PGCQVFDAGGHLGDRLVVVKENLDLVRGYQVLLCGHRRRWRVVTLLHRLHELTWRLYAEADRAGHISEHRLGEGDRRTRVALSQSGDLVVERLQRSQEGGEVGRVGCRVRRVELDQSGGDGLSDSWHYDGVVPDVGVGSVLRADGLRQVDDDPVGTGWGLEELVNEAVVTEAVLDHQPGVGARPGVAGIALVEVRIRSRVTDERVALQVEPADL